MNKSKKIALGIATLWPFIYMFLFLMLGGTIMRINNDTATVAISAWVTAMTMATMVLIPTVFIIYMVDVFKNKNIPANQRAIWGILLFMGSFLVMPIYFYLFIWKNHSKE